MSDNKQFDFQNFDLFLAVTGYLTHDRVSAEVNVEFFILFTISKWEDEEKVVSK